MRKSYYVRGMHCQSCVEKITHTLKDWVKSAEVNFEPPRAVLQDAVLPDLSELNNALKKIGNYELVEEVNPAIPTEKPKNLLVTYYPLMLILAMLTVVSFAGALSWHQWMLHFMAGFFITFSFFKLLDLSGFSEAYAGYDLLAKRWRGYGFIYPFLELILGLFFLFQFQLRFALYFSIILMSFSSLGVIQALYQHHKIRCACLGTVLNLPMSTITLLEDFAMIIMAIGMLAVM